MRSATLKCVQSTKLESALADVQHMLKVANEERKVAAEERKALAEALAKADAKAAKAAEERKALAKAAAEAADRVAGLEDFKRRAERAYTSHHLYIAHSVIVERVMHGLLSHAPDDPSITPSLQSLGLIPKRRRAWSQKFRSYRSLQRQTTTSKGEEIDRRKRVGQMRDNLFKLLWVDEGAGTFAWDPKLPPWMHDGIAMVLTTQAMHDAWWELHRLVRARHEYTHPKFVEMDQAQELLAHMHSSLPTEFGALQGVIREGLKPLTSMYFIETAAPPALSTRLAIARAAN